MDFSNYFEILKYGFVILKCKVIAFLFLRINKLIQIFYRGKKIAFNRRLNIFSFSFKKILLFLSQKNSLVRLHCEWKSCNIFQYQIYSSECLVEFISNFSLS